MKGLPLDLATSPWSPDPGCPLPGGGAWGCSAQALTLGLAGDGHGAGTRCKGTQSKQRATPRGGRPGTAVVPGAQEVPKGTLQEGWPTPPPGTWDWGEPPLPFCRAPRPGGTVPVATAAGCFPCTNTASPATPQGFYF